MDSTAKPRKLRNPPTSFVILIFISVLVDKTCPEKSLFDEIPLNGALVPEGENPVSSSSESVETFVPFKASLSHPKNENSEDEKQNVIVTASLFDEVPNQGASNVPEFGRTTLIPMAPTAPSHAPTLNKIRNTRDSVDFDVVPVQSSQEIQVPYWDKQFLAPIVNSFSSRPPPPPVTRPPRRFSLFGPFRSIPQSPPSHSYGPPPLPPRRQELHGWGKRDEKGHVSATSGGPTVIVYTNPKKEGGSDKGGWSAPTTTEAPVKNEIHYHYHINEQSTEKPQGPQGYGRGPAPPSWKPPRSGYQSPPSAIPTSNTYTIDKANKGSFQSTYSGSDQDDFNRRSFSASFGFGKGFDKAADSVFPPTPSTSYEVPPGPLGNPSSSYGVPQSPSKEYGPPKDPTPSYGPPAALPPAPPPAQADAGADQYETTITLQTIPITRQVTELVQVPNVVHRINSNRPVSAQGFQDEAITTPPSIAYGPPSHSHSHQKMKTSSNIPLSPTSAVRDGDRPFESHLNQILGTNLQSQSQSSSTRDSLVQDLILNQARSPGLDLTLSDLELIGLLQTSKNQNPTVPILQPQRLQTGIGIPFRGNIFGGGNTFSSTGQGQGWGNSDSLTSLREAIREQRLQLALQDLRKQLREQNRDNQRERSSYRSIFSKGAMLLSALSLIPTMISPMAATLGGSTSASAAATASIPNFMLPVARAFGRRKRSILEKEEGCWDWNWVGQGSDFPRKLKNCKKSRATGYLNPFILSCIQKEVCIIIEENKGVDLVHSYELLFQNLHENPWINQALSAAERRQCEIFKCPLN